MEWPAICIGTGSVYLAEHGAGLGGQGAFEIAVLGACLRYVAWPSSTVFVFQRENTFAFTHAQGRLSRNSLHCP